MTDETSEQADEAMQPGAEGAMPDGAVAEEAVADDAGLEGASASSSHGGDDDLEPVSDPQILQTLDAAISLAASLVQVKRPPMPQVVWHPADLPETRTLADGETMVVLVRDTDMAQVVRHAGHEAIHVVCGVASRHWSHEMIAELFSLEFIRRQRDPYSFGLARAEAGRDDTPAPGLEPPVSFGAAYNTADALLRVMKPSQLYAMGRYPATDEGVREWLASLPPKTAAKARAVIRTTIGDVAEPALG